MTRNKNIISEGETPALFVEEGLLKELLRKVVENTLEEEVERFLGAAEPVNEMRHSGVTI